MYRRIDAELERQPEIRSVAAVNHLPLRGVATYVDARVDDRAGGDPRTGSVFYYPVSSDFLDLMQIPVRRGRGLGEGDAAGPPVVVINETAARRLWSGGDALGDRLYLKTYSREVRPFTVVGIAADTRTFWTSLDSRPTAWVPWPGDPPPDGMDFVLATAAAPELLEPSIRRAVRSADPELPILDVVRLESYLWDTVELPRFYMMLMGVFSGIGVALAVVGLLGVLTYWVQSRSREIGVRLALGARPTQVVRMVLAQGSLLVGAGVVLGVAGAVGLTRFLESFLWGLDPLDPLAFGATTALLVAVALAACWLPARRAARVDPLEALTGAR